MEKSKVTERACPHCGHAMKRIADTPDIAKVDAWKCPECWQLVIADFLF